MPSWGTARGWLLPGAPAHTVYPPSFAPHTCLGRKGTRSARLAGLSWRWGGSCGRLLSLTEPSRPLPLVCVQAQASIACPKLVNALWEHYLGPGTPVPEARKKWIQSARALLCL